MSATPSNLVREMLDEYGTLVRGELGKYLDRREPRRHLYDLACDYPERGGRMLRSSLCLATARAFGGQVEDALRTAVAVEMMHNAFLVHDDVEDAGEVRRGRPTLNALYGVPMAVNAGDALAVMSLRPLLDNKRRLGPRLTLRILEESERMARESVEGQAIELGWRHDNVLDLSEKDYMEMILKKTCWYTTIHPCRVGALIATRDGLDLDQFIRFGFFLGAAFQIEDDLLNLVGDERRYGKEINGDLWEGKRTLMLIHAMTHATIEDRGRLEAVFSVPRARRQIEDVRWTRRHLEACGSLDYAREVAHGLAGAALHEFARVFGELPDSRDKQFVEGLTTWMLNRA